MTAGQGGLMHICTDFGVFSCEGRRHAPQKGRKNELCGEMHRIAAMSFSACLQGCLSKNTSFAAVIPSDEEPVQGTV